MSAAVIFVATSAALCAGLAGGCLAYRQALRHQSAKRHAWSLRQSMGEAGEDAVAAQRSRLSTESRLLRWMRQLAIQINAGSAVAFSPAVRTGRAASTRAGRFFEGHASKAGCRKTISHEAFCEAGLRLGAAFAVAGALVGVTLSNEMALFLGLGGAVVGAAMPRRALLDAQRKRGLEAFRCLSEMLEVVALGLRSGLTFDRSFALYGQYFDSEFAQSCEAARRHWSLGLATREEALKELADSYDCDALSQVVSNIIRSLRLGSALTQSLEESAAQARAAYKTVLEERVAKAPVKMMLPTGTLILPAMLLLVLGPILLELASGF